MSNSTGSSVFGGMFMIIFGLIWVSMTSMIPSFIGALFSLIGILVMCMGVHQIIRARRPEERIVDPYRPPEGPGSERDEEEFSRPPESDGLSAGYCPWCGSALHPGHLYCGVCGRKLRWRAGGGRSARC